MITIKIDKSKFSELLKNKFVNIIDPTSTIYRQLAVELIPIIQKRIHVQGLAADGKEIGIYTNSYLKVRMSNSTSKKRSASRKNYNRSSDPKVIISLTRQLENDYAVIGTVRGWGIGFNNQLNANKARWNNKRYGGRTIYDLTKDEIDFSISLITNLIAKEFE